MSRRLLTVTDVIEETGIPRNTLYKLMDAGSLPFAKIGAKRFVREDVLDQFLSRFSAHPQQEHSPWPEATDPSTGARAAARHARTSG